MAAVPARRSSAGSAADLPCWSVTCLNAGVEQVCLPVIPEQCRLRHRWGPGLVSISWDECDCPNAEAARGGHITVRCGHPRCLEIWQAPRHTTAHLRAPL